MSDLVNQLDFEILEILPVFFTGLFIGDHPGNAFKIEKFIKRHRTEFRVIGDNPNFRRILDDMPFDHAFAEIGIRQSLRNRQADRRDERFIIVVRIKRGIGKKGLGFPSQLPAQTDPRQILSFD